MQKTAINFFEGTLWQYITLWGEKYHYRVAKASWKINFFTIKEGKKTVQSDKREQNAIQVIIKRFENVIHDRAIITYWVVFACLIFTSNFSHKICFNWKAFDDVSQTFSNELLRAIVKTRRDGFRVAHNASAWDTSTFAKLSGMKIK